jgi:hypothetical protein
MCFNLDHMEKIRCAAEISINIALYSRTCHRSGYNAKATMVQAVQLLYAAAEEL